MRFQVAIHNSLYPTFAEFSQREHPKIELYLTDNATGRYSFIYNRYPQQDYFIGISFENFTDALTFSLTFPNHISDGIWEVDY